MDFSSISVAAFPLHPAPLVQSCCQEKNVPEMCMGLCMPANLLTSRFERINACTSYKGKIVECVLKYNGVEANEDSGKTQ